MDFARFREKNYDTAKIQFNFRQSTQVHVFGSEQAQPNAVATASSTGVNTIATTATVPTALTSQASSQPTVLPAANASVGSPATGSVINHFLPDNVTLRNNKLTDQPEFDTWINEISVNSSERSTYQS